jgi:hypothetical protein
MEDQEFKDQVLVYLGSIDRHLKLLALETLSELRAEIHTTLLTTASRRKMWDEIDGEKSISEIGRSAGVTAEAARLFFKEIDHSPHAIIQWIRTPRARIPKKLV